MMEVREAPEGPKCWVAISSEEAIPLYHTAAEFILFRDPFNVVEV